MKKFSNRRGPNRFVDISWDIIDTKEGWPLPVSSESNTKSSKEFRCSSSSELDSSSIVYCWEMRVEESEEEWGNTCKLVILISVSFQPAIVSPQHPSHKQQRFVIFFTYKKIQGTLRYWRVWVVGIGMEEYSQRNGRAWADLQTTWSYLPQQRPIPLPIGPERTSRSWDRASTRQSTQPLASWNAIQFVISSVISNLLSVDLSNRLLTSTRNCITFLNFFEYWPRSSIHCF